MVVVVVVVVVVAARRLLAVPLRVEHLPEGRRDGAHPRTHAEMQSAATGWCSVDVNLYRTDKGLFWNQSVSFLYAGGIEQAKYCAVVNNSYSAGAFAPIYIPIQGPWREEERERQGGREKE